MADKIFVTEEDYSVLEKNSVDTLCLFLRGDISDDRLISGARIAASVFSSCQKRKTALSSRDALNFMMAREIASDKTELQVLINKSMPDSPLAKKIK